MKSLSSAALLVALTVTLAACGTEKQSASAQLVGTVIGLFGQGRAGPPPGPDELLTRDVINTVTVPYAMVGIERRGAYASMTLAGQNGTYNSWVTSDGAGIILNGDILSGTKGLGADLVTADVASVRAALAARNAADFQRSHGYLDGEGRTFTITYRCTLAPAGTERITIIGASYDTLVFTESCTSGQESFENKYWIGQSDGIMWQSRQWVSADVGPVLVLNLVPIPN